MKATKYTALNDDGRVMYSRVDSFGSIAQAVRHCCAFYCYRYDDGRRIAAATFVEVIGADGYPRRYRITCADLRRLRWVTA